MNKLYYLAYGSNLHPFRLIQRELSPTLIGTVKIPDTKIVFHKRSVDKSGKCMIVKDEIAKPIAYGVLYSIDIKEQGLLDKVEGKGYSKQFVQCPVGKKEYSAFTCVADSNAIDPSLKPYHWYKQFVLYGAQYHKFPEYYIKTLEAVESIQDQDNARILLNEKILENIKKF